MGHDEKHAALAAYAFWCKLEQTGEDKGVLMLHRYYRQLFNNPIDLYSCPACVIARLRSGRCGKEMCKSCPCEWGVARCESSGSAYRAWQLAPDVSSESMKAAGDVANIMRKWCERVGVLAPRGDW